MAFEKAVKRLNALEKDPKISGVLDVFNWTFGEISKSDQGISKDQMTSYNFSALKKSADSLLKIFELPFFLLILIHYSYLHTPIYLYFIDAI